MKKLRCSYPLLLTAALLVAFDSDGTLLLVLAAAAIHELGHLAAIELSGARVRAVRLTLGGMVIEYDGSRLSYFQDLLAALAGPGASLFSGWFFSRLALGYPSEGLYFFVGANILLGLFNLLPVLPLDGGRALLNLLSAGTTPDRAERLCGQMTAVFGTLLLLAGVWLLLRYRNPSLLLTGLLLLRGSGYKNTLQPAGLGVL